MDIPSILISREAWGAEPPTERRNQAGQLVDPYDTHKPTGIVLHHSYLPDAAGFKGHDSIAAIQRYHQHTKGWADIGYHLIVAPDGLSVYQGRPLHAIGAHCCGTPPKGVKRLFGNTGKIGVCLIGDYDRETPQPQAVLTLSALFDWLSARFGKLTEHGHFQAWSTPPKTCPGKFLAEAMGFGHAWRKAFPNA